MSGSNLFTLGVLPCSWAQILVRGSAILLVGRVSYLREIMCPCWKNIGGAGVNYYASELIFLLLVVLSFILGEFTTLEADFWWIMGRVLMLGELGDQLAESPHL